MGNFHIHPVRFLFFVSVFFLSCRSTETKKEEKISTLPESVSLPVENRYVSKDLSPMDMSYFPAEYPVLKMKDKNAALPVARIIYSRPGKRNRPIFSNSENSLCPYGKPWRLGANESSEIEFFRNVEMGEKQIKAGRYIIYCIPHEKTWTIRLNTDIYSWGLRIDSTLDIAEMEVPVKKSDDVTEDFTMVFLPSGEGMELLMAWDSVEVRLPFTIKK